jgi:uncharacterized membrane protein YjjP (DUF1212 family)
MFDCLDTATVDLVAPEATIAMCPALALLFFSGSRDSWLSFALGIAAGLAVVLISKRLRRKEDR